MIRRDGHIRVLPLHVANKIAAGEVVERPASVVKELVENAIDAGSRTIRITIAAGGRKLVSVQDDGCGMTRDDALLSLERQATSKILDVNDIEEIDTLGFRGEAIPSIASVSRFSITTRRKDSDEGTFLQVNAGTIAEVRAAGCPPGTLVEVRDLFCNVPARRKFLKSYSTEESHVKSIFTVHALAHPEIGFSLTVDGRELYRLAPATTATDRILDLFGKDFVEDLLPLSTLTTDVPRTREISVTGFIERPNLSTPTRHDQYVFVNGRPASAPSIAYALREAYPHRAGETKPAAILFLNLPPNQVDVNVHPTKREVRFRDNGAVRQAVALAIETALRNGLASRSPATPQQNEPKPVAAQPITAQPVVPQRATPPLAVPDAPPDPVPHQTVTPHVTEPSAALPPQVESPRPQVPMPQPVPLEFAIDPDSSRSKPWQWFKFLAQTSAGYLLIETDDGIVTINPQAARERIAFERLMDASSGKVATTVISQDLLIPETIRLSPPDFARVKASLETIAAMGFQLEEFGHDTFKVDAVPQLIGTLPAATILSTIARDLADSSTKRAGNRWREELVAKSIARSFAGASTKLTEDGANRLVEELCACRMPYVCPRGKRILMFTSNRELRRKFEQD